MMLARAVFAERLREGALVARVAAAVAAARTNVPDRAPPVDEVVSESTRAA